MRRKRKHAQLHREGTPSTDVASTATPVVSSWWTEARFRWLILGGILLLGLLLYGHTLSFPFVFDDHLYLLRNPLVRDAGSFAFHGDFAAFATYAQRNGLDRDLSTNFILRPVSYFTFYLNYLADGMNPRGFRAANIVLHCTNAFLVFLLLTQLLRAPSKGVGLSLASKRFIPVVSALFYLVHPLQIESVTYIIQRFTSLAVFFYLLTLLAHLRSVTAPTLAAARLWRGGSLVTLIFGMLSKEDVFTAPFAIILLDWLILGIPIWKAIWRARFHLLCLPIIPTLIVMTVWAQNAARPGYFEALNVANAFASADYHYFYALTQASVVLAYLRRIIAPFGLNLDPDYSLSTSLFELRVVLSAMAIAALVGGAWFVWRRRRDNLRVCLIFYSVLWYFLTLAISSSVVPLPDVIAEHRCLLSSIGVFVSLAVALDAARSRFEGIPNRRFVAPAIAAVWICALCVATHLRNEVWRSEISLWRDSVAKSPKKHRPWMNLAGGYYREGNYEEMVRCLWRVVALNPGQTDAWNDLTSGLLSLKRPQECLHAARRALEQGVDFARLRYNMGIAYVSLGDFESSNVEFKRAIDHDRNHGPSYVGLAVNSIIACKFEEALSYFRIAAALEPLTPFQQQVLGSVESMVQSSNSLAIQ